MFIVEAIFYTAGAQ